MHYALVYGSVREARQGIKAARFLEKKLKDQGHTVDFIDAREEHLPFLDKMHREYPPGTAPKNIEKLSQRLIKADGFLIVSGEYNHSIPPALKNLLDYFKPEYQYKPSAIACYSGGPFGGVRVAMHLRAVLCEIGTPSIPTLFPMSTVQSSFDEQGNVLQGSYETNVKKFLDEFDWYASALKARREVGLP